MPKRGTSKSKKQAQAIKCFKVGMFRLLAHRAFVDYLTVKKTFKNTEPEHFLEDWSNKISPPMYKEEEKAFWGEFMYLLVERSEKFCE